MHVQEWATGKKSEWEPSTGMKGMQVVQPNLEHYPGLEALDPKVDGPSTPEPFNKDWNKTIMQKLLTNLRSTAAKARAKWDRPDQNALQEWEQFMEERCYDEQAALEWLGTFQWPQHPNTGDGLGVDSRREESGRVGPLLPVTHSTESFDERNTRRLAGKEAAEIDKHGATAERRTRARSAIESLSVGTHVRPPATLWEEYLMEHPDERPEDGLHYHAVVRSVDENLQARMPGKIDVHVPDGTIFEQKASLA